MKIKIFCIGKMKSPWLVLWEEYALRLKKKGISLEVFEFETKKISDEKTAFEKENEWLSEKISKESGEIIFLDRAGKLVSSEDLSKILGEYRDYGKSPVFVIGGSHGFSQKLQDQSGVRISFSKMTFPHLLFRVILCEQMYRAISILDGDPYHK